MKKLLMLAVAVLFVFGLSINANAVVLNPGDTDFPEGLDLPDGELLASLIDVPFTGTDAFGGVYFTGTLSQWVYENEAGILFAYQFYNDSDSLDPISRLSTTAFTDYLTDVDAQDESVFPLYISRSGSGSTISFDWANIEGLTTVGPDETSALLWIQTDARYYGRGSTVLIDGGRAAVATYAPAVPEPATMSLLGMGILGLFGLRRKRA